MSSKHLKSSLLESQAQTGGSGSTGVSSSSGMFDSPRRTIEINNAVERRVDPLAAVLKSRQKSIDVFRGATMLFMILVDNQGKFGDAFVYEQFSEDLWDGIRLCNFVFPAFLFIMGTAVAISNDKFVRPRKSESGLVGYAPPVPMGSAVWRHIVQRFVLLFGIGLLLNIWGSNFKDHFRVMGVLQRIAVCYIIVVLLFVLLTNRWLQRAIVWAGFGGLYLGVMYGVDVPGVGLDGEACGRGKVTLFCNASGYIDRKVFGDKWMLPFTDPEGIVSTLTALITTWCGLECGRFMCDQKHEKQQIFDGGADDAWGKHKWLLGGWFAWGSVLLVVGGVLSIWMPLNKEVWSFSFALVTAGSSAVVLALLHAAIDVPWACCGLGDNYVLMGAGRSGRRKSGAGGAADGESYGSIRMSPPELRDGHGRSNSMSRDNGSSGCCGGCSSCECGDGGECRPVSVWHASLQPLIWLGMNPIAVFIGMVALEIILLDSAPGVLCHGCDSWLIPDGVDPNSTMPVWDWLYYKAAVSWIGDRKGASMFVAAVHVLIWEVVAAIMYWRRVFLKL